MSSCCLLVNFAVLLVNLSCLLVSFAVLLVSSCCLLVSLRVLLANSYFLSLPHKKSSDSLGIAAPSYLCSCPNIFCISAILL
ncbi:hypothetical protein QUF86_11080 [Peribacillus sp. NJ11]|uniref:hypothetical protein n=1 Tax=Peribacillus sp. NJ11 TaxID=3055861 RepID=UPI0025A00C04|nr:hypothetical protein [Peribacillus sp. NJ11]MDM5221259.1 hypothetical protein [Peribacillus sp. NJ11]